MPDLQNADIVFTAIIGSMTLALTLLTLREDFLRLKHRSSAKFSRSIRRAREARGWPASCRL